MTLSPWRPLVKGSHDPTNAKARALTIAMKRTIQREHHTLWKLAKIWSRDCPAKLRRLQAVDWETVFSRARWTGSRSIPRL